MDKLDKLSQEVTVEARERLSYFRKASPINREYMHKLLDFVWQEFGLRPRVAPAGQICFRPQFFAIVFAGKRDFCRVTISVYGTEFRTGAVTRGKYPNWRSYTIYNEDDFREAQNVIREAYQHRINEDYDSTCAFEREVNRLVEYYSNLAVA